MRKGIILCFFLLGINIFSQSNEAKLKELISLTKSDRMLSMGFQGFMDHYNNKYKDLPSNFWDEFKKDMTPDKIFELYIPIYKKYFTDADVDALIKFYKTPAGQKLIENMPSLMKESMEIANNFAEGLNKKVNDKLNKHYHFQDPPPPAP
ncbi:DUF2059 domain-containing protein [Chryseobacterium sp. Tr-659]|uniref:DUF2059 domain-containing protein n=1 Tax=Chryseobacterium sp. Tr-659 TaxID=2608340 RepID=UPI00141E2985|nr:DUF2059 domain-containing protein [Chryseobacterium sp. Tr-659]NIF07002.1 DUF2059 domain-containing protein [Chryseobacterium sp. Tr-659]